MWTNPQIGSEALVWRPTLGASKIAPCLRAWTAPGARWYLAISPVHAQITAGFTIPIRAGSLEIPVTWFPFLLANPLAFFGPGRRLVLLGDGVKRWDSESQRCDK